MVHMYGDGMGMVWGWYGMGIDGMGMLIIFFVVVVHMIVCIWI